MQAPTSCAHCGANLGPADLDKPACVYCGTAHPHVAEARQRVEALRQVFAQGVFPGATPPGQGPSPWPSHVPPPILPPSFGVMPPPPPVGVSRIVVFNVVLVFVIVGAMFLAVAVS